MATTYSIHPRHRHRIINTYNISNIPSTCISSTIRLRLCIMRHLPRGMTIQDRCIRLSNNRHMVGIMMHNSSLHTSNRRHLGPSRRRMRMDPQRHQYLDLDLDLLQRSSPMALQEGLRAVDTTILMEEDPHH
jgi:hypothetical protein